MPWLRRDGSAGRAGILATRQQAQPALLRMLSRARRRASGLALVRIRSEAEAAAPAAGFQRFVEELAAELRVGDLLWQEAGGVVMVLLEDTDEAAAAAVLERLQRCAHIAGARPQWRSARFPEQGLTLQALLEELQWAY